MRWPALLATLLLAAVPALAATPAPPVSAYASKEGVTYFLAYGPLGQGALASGPAYDGSGLVHFDGCAFLQLRPAFGAGRAVVTGQVDGGSDLVIQVDELHGPKAGPAEVADGLATNLTIDGSLEGGSPTHPKVLADAVIWGVAHGFFLDPEKARLENFTDPVGGGSDLEATMFVTRQGYRDPASNGIKTLEGGWFDPGTPTDALLGTDTEVHLRIRSPPGAQPSHASAAFASAGTLPGGLIAPSDRYNATYQMFNSRFGGQANVHLAATTLAPAGSNSLRFSWYSPTGDLVGSKTLAPAVAADAQADLAFPLAQFGTYSLVVSGKAALSSYTVNVDLAPAKSFDLNFWWHGTVLGERATNGLQDCEQELNQRSGAGVVPVSTHVGRDRPPGFPVALVAVALVGAAATVMLLVKLITEAASAAALRKMGK